MIVVVDYGMGNLRSITKAFERLGLEAKVSSEKAVIKSASRLILPGVGHFANGMKNLVDLGLIETLEEKILLDKIPILGICLGMQLLTKFSEEGNIEGLGFIDANTVRFSFDTKNNHLKIPHMGWNKIIISNKDRILDNIKSTYFYFVHSYHVVCNNKEDVLTTTSFGYQFDSSLKRDNIYGMQFHPEKSHSSGLKLLENFSKI